MRPQALGALYGGLATALLGISFVASSTMSDFPHLGGQSVRYAAGFLLLCLLAARTDRSPLRRLTARLWLRLAVIGATGLVGMNVAVLQAVRTAEPTVPGVVVACSPVVVAALTPLVERRRPAARPVLAAVVVTAGAAVVQGFGRTDLAGALWSVTALVGEVTVMLLIGPAVRALGPMLLSLCVCLLAALEAGAAGLLLDGSGWLRTPTGVEAAALAWQAVMVTAVCFLLWFAAVQRIGAQRMALLTGVAPVAAALTAPLVGTGAFGLAQLGGSLLVTVGVALGSSGATSWSAAASRTAVSPAGSDTPSDVSGK
ncbi:EamA family transporter [Streptomyces sp. NPDC006365]|uniref:EamA family transporter n=1 Tax=Streptomyces sp. NPDC006365 TaxID=3364744 RepID=UPI0036D03212